VYKGERFSLRTVEEVIADLDAMQAAFGQHVATVFLQDANPILTRPDDLVTIVKAIRQRFPHANRITAYARSHTLAHRSLRDLKRIREAGLDRVHIGMESACDQVLKMMCKGATREQQILGGQKAREAGFEVSEYFMPGLGGREYSKAHADDSASALREIKPHFIRLRTTMVVPGTPLAEMQTRGEFVPLNEVEVVTEIRRFLSGLQELEVRLESDHMMNLIMGIRGDLPDDMEFVLGMCDTFLSLPAEEQEDFISRRRQFGLRLI